MVEEIRCGDRQAAARGFFFELHPDDAARGIFRPRVFASDGRGAVFDRVGNEAIPVSL